MSFTIFAIIEDFCIMTLKNQGVFSLIKSYLTNTQRHLFQFNETFGGVRN